MDKTIRDEKSIALTEKIFALKSVVGFNMLNNSDLFHIAGHAKCKYYQPGSTIFSQGQVLNMLYIVIQGSIESTTGESIPPVIGVLSLLFDKPLSETLVISREQGAVCLIIEKSHFYTLFYQYPALLRKLSEITQLR